MIIFNFARIRFTIAMLEYKPGKEVAKFKMKRKLMQESIVELVVISFPILRGIGLLLPCLSTSLARKSQNWK